MVTHKDTYTPLSSLVFIGVRLIFGTLAIELRIALLLIEVGVPAYLCMSI